MTMPQHERRRDVRVRVELKAERVLRAGSQDVEIVEASYRGVLIKTGCHAPLNELMKLRTVINGNPIILHAVPVRETIFRRSLAVGCKLFALDGNDKRDWQNFVSSLLRAEVRAA